MRSFREAGLDVEGVLRAIVLGGAALGAKPRRTVPGKQEALVRLVAERGRTDLGELREAFPEEWTRIAARHKGGARRLADREFFRNIADLASRVNAALVAAYKSPEGAALAGGYIGLTFDYATFSVSWTSTRSLDALSLQTADATHVSLRAPEPPALEIAVSEDPVTGVWRFALDGHAIEVAPQHGYVKVDGRLHELDAVRGLMHVEDLAGLPIGAIRRLLSAS
jgi:hypothetical protein